MKVVSKKELRQVTVLVRYLIKSTKSVILYVENDRGDRYYVTLNRNGNHSCNCKATKACYHIARARELENARIEARKASKQVVELPSGIAPINGTLRVKGPVLTKTTDISTKGALTTNRGFQLMAS